MNRGREASIDAYAAGPIATAMMSDTDLSEFRLEQYDVLKGLSARTRARVLHRWEEAPGYTAERAFPWLPCAAPSCSLRLYERPEPEATEACRGCSCQPHREEPAV